MRCVPRVVDCGSTGAGHLHGYSYDVLVELPKVPSCWVPEDFRCGALRRTDLRSSPERRASSLCGSAPRPGLQFGLLSWAFRWVRPSDAIPLAPRSGRLRTRPDPRTNGWKACWGQPLTSSNLVSSAIALTGQYVEGPRSSLRGPSTLLVSPLPVAVGCPFQHLVSHGVREVRTDRGPGSPDTDVGELRATGVAGRLVPELRVALLRELSLLGRIARMLLDQYLSPSLHGELRAAVGLGLEPVEPNLLPAGQRQRNGLRRRPPHPGAARVRRSEPGAPRTRDSAGGPPLGRTRARSPGVPPVLAHQTGLSRRPAPRLQDVIVRPRMPALGRQPLSDKVTRTAVEPAGAT